MGKKIKQKTHKASKKRFKVTGTGKVRHLGQGSGNGHSNNYKSRKQKRSPKGMRALSSKKESRKIKSLIGE
jgi:large subunit ribosomal protein L35